MKAHVTSLWSLAIVSLTLHTACGSKSDDEKKDDQAATSAYTYTDTKAIVDTHCASAGCHAAGSVNKALTTLAEIKAVTATKMLTRIRATDATRMPQDNANFATSADGQVLIDWLEGGADLK